MANENREINNANNPSHYTLMAVGIVITMVGIVARFFGTFRLIDIISNVILVIGVIICLSSVAKILK